LKATDDPKSLSRKEQKIENRSSKENHWKKLTSFNWAFTKYVPLRVGCKPYNVVETSFSLSILHLYIKV
jgi:hypothetical protein